MGKLGADLSAEALAGAGLAGGRIFEFDNQDDANAFQESVQAAGGFDGILRDLASYNDEIPFLGWDNPLGGVDDWALDQLGVDDNGDLPKPTETYMEGKAFLNSSADAAAGIGVIDGELKGLIEGAGVVQVVSSGKNEGDVTFTVELNADASGGLTAGALGGNVNGQLAFTAQITLDAQNGYKPDKLVLKGNAGYTGSIDAQAAARGRRPRGPRRRAREGLAVGLRGPRPGPRGLGRARPQGPGEPRRDAAGADQPGPGRAPARRWRSTRTASSASTPTTSRPPRPRARSRSAWDRRRRRRQLEQRDAERPHRPGADARRELRAPPVQAAFMMPRAHRLSALLVCLLAGSLASCGGGDFSGDAEGARRLQDLQHRRHLLRLPGDWEVAERTDADGAPAVEITPPEKAKTPYGLIQLSISPGAGERFQSLADQRRIVIRDVNNAKIDSDEPVEIPGAKEALRASTITPPGRGTDPIEVRSNSLDVLRDNGDVVVLPRPRRSARAPSSTRGPSCQASGSARTDAAVRRPRAGLAAARGRVRARWRAGRGAVAPLLAAFPAVVAGLERTSPAVVLLAAALTRRPGSSPSSPRSRGSRGPSPASSSGCASRTTPPGRYC